MNKITLDQALELVKNNDKIITGLGGGEAKGFMTRLHEILDKVNNISITTCLSLGSYEFMKPDYQDRISMYSLFYNKNMRDANKTNHNAVYCPSHLHLCGKWHLEAYGNPNIFIVTVSPFNKHGYCSMSFGSVYERRCLEAADMVIVEVNKNAPFVLGDTVVHESEIDYCYEVDIPLPQLPVVPVSDKDQKIGEHIAKYINDGDTLQLGIGGIPNALCPYLMEKKNLGIHTEMLTSGVVDLVKAGVVNNKEKSLNRYLTVASFMLGDQNLYDFVDNNPCVRFLDCFYVNMPSVMAQNDNMVSINTALEVDLSGQCCSESIGSTQFSGTGGQTDTAVGAQHAKNGRSFIALHSTASIKMPDGSKKVVSKIVPVIKPGAYVTLSRNDVDMVVTEYGVAKLKGVDMFNRVKRLIAIAHPDFREELMAQAKEMGIYKE